MITCSSESSYQGEEMAGKTEIENLSSPMPEGAQKAPPKEEESLQTWMAFPVKESHNDPNCKKIQETKEAGNDPSIIQRAAEWGLLVKSGNSNNPIVVFPSSAEVGKQSMDRVSEAARTSNESNYAVESSIPEVSQELKDALSSLQQTFVVSDARNPDSPIMYVSAGFFRMTGYSAKEAIGRNCRFLQGPETDKKEVAKIREAVRTGKSYCGRLLNYKKNGTPFWNLLTVTPIRDDSGNIIKFIGLKW